MRREGEGNKRLLIGRDVGHVVVNSSRFPKYSLANLIVYRKKPKLYIRPEKEAGNWTCGISKRLIINLGIGHDETKC